MTIVPPDADDVGNLADLAPIPEDRGVWSTQLPTWFAEGAGLAADPRAAPSAGSNDNPWAKFNPRAAEERQAAAGAGSRPKKGEPGYKPRGCRAGQGGKWGSREARVSYMRQEEVVRMALDMGRRGLEPCVMPDGTKGWRPKGAGKSVQAANKGAGKGAAAPPAPVPVKAPGHAKGEPAAACAGKGDAPCPCQGDAGEVRERGLQATPSGSAGQAGQGAQEAGTTSPFVGCAYGCTRAGPLGRSSAGSLFSLSGHPSAGPSGPGGVEAPESVNDSIWLPLGAGWMKRMR